MSGAVGGRKVIYQCIERLAHAKQCANVLCSIDGCMETKKYVHHYEECSLGTKGDCGVCIQLEGICVYHTRTCRNKACGVPFCSRIKAKAKESQVSSKPPRKSGSTHRRSASVPERRLHSPNNLFPPPYGKDMSSAGAEVASPMVTSPVGLPSSVSMGTLPIESTMCSNMEMRWGPAVPFISPPSTPTDAFASVISQELDEFLRQLVCDDANASETQQMNGMTTESNVQEARKCYEPTGPGQQSKILNEVYGDEGTFTSENVPFFSEPVSQVQPGPLKGQLLPDLEDVFSECNASKSCKDQQDSSPPSALTHMIETLRKIEKDPVLRKAFERDYKEGRDEDIDPRRESTWTTAVARKTPTLSRAATEPSCREIGNHGQSTGEYSNLRRTQSLPNASHHFPTDDPTVMIQKYLVDPFIPQREVKFKDLY